MRHSLSLTTLPAAGPAPVAGFPARVTSAGRQSSAHVESRSTNFGAWPADVALNPNVVFGLDGEASVAAPPAALPGAFPAGGH